MRTVKYYLGDILKDGLPCSNAIVRWETLSPCIVLTCHLPDKVVDGKKLTNGVEFSIDDDMENCSPCVKYHIECPGCTNCPIVDKTLCFCTGPTDCPPCHVCINGECIPTCDICDPVTGDCVSCNDEHPCPGDQICVQGECQCPQGKYDPVTGKCVECIVGDVNPNNPCLICLGGSWAQKICASGVVDPVTCDCTGCNGNTDCGENQCCYDGECLCCKDSAIYDPILGKCVPKPPCGPDTPCPECMDCLNGQCVPRICPEGYICVGDSCVPECDCNNPTCNTANACVPTAGGKCYCSPCSGPCATNANCGPGCYCDNGQCKPKPCVGTCVNGGDCGPGCGCLNGECVPCDSVDCQNNPSLCSQILGCKCSSGGCEKAVGCNDEECATASDCNDGCTCDEGICKECANYSCEDCANHPGCKCLSGVCVNDPDNECKDKLTLTKIDETCDLKAELTLAKGCACSVLTLDSKISNISYNNNTYHLDLLIELRKGKFITSPLLGDTTNPNIADNDKPILGMVKITILRGNLICPKTQGLTGSGNCLRSETKIELSPINFADKDSVLRQIDLLEIGHVLDNNQTSITTVENYKVIIEQTADFVFVNGCTYKAKKEIKPNYSFTSNGNFQQSLQGYIRFINLTSPNDRNPLFTWYKGKGSLEVFRRLYIPKVNGKYTDTLFGLDSIPKGKYPLTGEEGEVWSGYDYTVSSDCGCAEDAGLDNVYFCNPKTLNATVTECNTKVNLLEPFVPCDVNRDIRKNNSGAIRNKPSIGYVIPQEVQSLYELYLNGILVKTFVWNQDEGKMVIYANGIYGTTPMTGSYTLPNKVTITDAYLKLNHGDCKIPITIPPPPNINIPNGTVNCTNDSGTYTLTVPTIINGYTIESIDGAVAYTIGSPNTVITLTKDVSVELTFHFVGGCMVKKTFEANCGCDEYNPSITVQGGSFCAPGNANFQIGGGITGATITYTLTINNVTGTPVVVPFTGPTMLVNVTDTATINILSSSYQGCAIAVNQSATITKVSVPIATISAENEEICSGSQGLLNFTGTPGAVVTVTPSTGSPFTVTIGVGGTASYNTPALTDTVDYNITLIALGTCQSVNGNNVTIEVSGSITPLEFTNECMMPNRVLSGFNQSVTITENGVTLVPVGGSYILSGTVQHNLVITYGGGDCTAMQELTTQLCECASFSVGLISAGVICGTNGSTILTASPAPAGSLYTYAFYDNNTNQLLQAASYNNTYLATYGGTFRVEVTNTTENCTSSATVVVANITNPNVTVTVDPAMNGDLWRQGQSSSEFVVCEDVTSFNFKGGPNGMAFYDWTVTSLLGFPYGGTTTGSGQIFTINPSEIDVQITIELKVTTSTGCEFKKYITVLTEPCDICHACVQDTSFLIQAKDGNFTIYGGDGNTTNPLVTGLNSGMSGSAIKAKIEADLGALYPECTADRVVTVTNLVPNAGMTGNVSFNEISITVENAGTELKYARLDAIGSPNGNLGWFGSDDTCGTVYKYTFKAFLPDLGIGLPAGALTTNSGAGRYLFLDRSPSAHTIIDGQSGVYDMNNPANVATFKSAIEAHLPGSVVTLTWNAGTSELSGVMTTGTKKGPGNMRNDLRDYSSPSKPITVVYLSRYI